MKCKKKNELNNWFVILKENVSLCRSVCIYADYLNDLAIIIIEIIVKVNYMYVRIAKH